MAKQLNMLSAGQVITTALHTEMQQSYLEYAMSVIVGRALPDVRDGLKPVHRRILYAMHELGLTPDRPYRKCARVVGDVLGKYHPHGDQAVYDALVRLVQDFSSRYPLLAGHGNFGSVDDDPPAAMRYTETRLAPIGNEALLTEIGEATVDFIGNFDNSQQEPIVLPAQLPILLLNGSSGIAVGMATNIPPHNLNEIVDGLIALIDNPNLSDERLFELIPGPDFPTGGEIVGTDGIRDAYTTGRGSVAVRGVAQIEEIQPGRGRHRRPAIVVTELPYQVNKAGWIEKIAELVGHGRLEGIADIRDESDRDGIRVVIELKREAHPQKVLNCLYKQTSLQNNFGVILLALTNSQPRQMTLRELLQHFLDFREETLTRLYQHELDRAESRLDLLNGMLIALENLDDVIDILRNAPDGSTAKAILQEELELSDRQADAILAMPLRRLTSMEQQNLQTEFDQLSDRQTELQKLLGDRRELLKALKKELRALKKKFGDPRRTRIVGRPELGEGQKSKKTDATSTELTAAIDSESTTLLPLDDEEPAEETVLEITQRGYARRISVKTLQRRNSRNEEQPVGLAEFEDFTIQTHITTTAHTILAITRDGKAYPIRMSDVPQTTGRSRGVPLMTLLPPAAQGSPDAIVASFVIPEVPEEQDLILVTQQGRVKRLPLEDFTDLTARGLTTLKLKDDDQVAFACITVVGEQLVLATSNGRMLRVEIDDDRLPLSSRTAQGQIAIRLIKQERLVGCVTVPVDCHLLMLSEKGYAKQMPVGLLRLSNPGDLGGQGLQFATKTDTLVGLAAAFSDSEIIVLTSADRMSYIDLEEVPVEGKDGKGSRILKLDRDEKITKVTSLEFTDLFEEEELEEE